MLLKFHISMVFERKYFWLLFCILINLPNLSKAFYSDHPQIVFDLNKSNTLSAFKIKYKNSEFVASNFGGIAVINRNGELFQPWSPGVKYLLLNKKESGNQFTAEWVMYKDNDFYYHYEVKVDIDENQTVIHFQELGNLDFDGLPSYAASAYALYLDRCESAINPVVIGIPYLTMFNILFANDCFVSMYFDWNKTNASQIIAYNEKSFSKTSEFYSQYALYNQLTNGMRNKLDETVYLKVSDNIDNVLPDLPNPVSKYKKESSERLVFDDWDDLNSIMGNIEKINQSGIKNIWHIVHSVQRSISSPVMSFYNLTLDDKENVKLVSEYDKRYGILLSVHENYCEMFTKSKEFNKNNLSLSSNGNFIFNWYDGLSADTSYLVKPVKLFDYVSSFSRNVHSDYNTNSSFHDVTSSYDPSKFVDYDYKTEGAGKFETPYRVFRSLADTLRMIHQGPVSGEGLAHFLYVGYYDDISSAQIHTAQSLPGSYGTETNGGYYKPILVNFDLLKMKEKATVHGVGYYDRFFYNHEMGRNIGRDRDSILMYSATEIAYGHGSFFRTLEQGEIEYKYVYPVQLRYGLASVKEIWYNDNGSLISASDYIRRHPYTFDKIDNKDFMGQIMVMYDNGLIVYVNRHPTKKWDLNISHSKTFVSAHCILSGSELLSCGENNITPCELPPNNGWLCYMN